LTRSRSCSSAASRRSELPWLGAAAALAAAAAIFLLAPPAAAADAAAPRLLVSVARQGAALTATLRLAGGEETGLLLSLQDGLETRVVFTARLYRKRTGLLSVFGDRLLSQVTVVRRAYRDILTQQFVVAQEGVAPAEYATVTALAEGLLVVPRISFPAPGNGSYSVAARVHVEPLLLKPPLTLVTLVGGTAAWESAWVHAGASAGGTAP
jgi:hypothetical protein